MKYYMFAALAVCALSVNAQQSSITEAEGYSCMGVDYSKKQTEQLALQDAKRQAVEFSKSYIESATEMENFNLKRDLVKAFAQAEVQVLTIIEQQWDDPTSSDCYTVRIQAEVIPIAQDLKEIAEAGGFQNDPSAPLTVRIWTNKAELVENEALKIYLRGNKPFFGRIIYQDASGLKLQLLPNPYRQDAYFQGGVNYEVPGGLDKFDMIVQGPFGKETVSVYASTAPLGDIDTNNLGPVLQVQAQDIAKKTRGIKVIARPVDSTQGSNQVISRVNEFAEDQVMLTTRSAP